MEGLRPSTVDHVVQVLPDLNYVRLGPVDCDVRRLDRGSRGRQQAVVGVPLGRRVRQDGRREALRGRRGGGDLVVEVLYERLDGRLCSGS